MTPTELLTSLRLCGAEVQVDGGDLVIRARRGAVTPELKAALGELKPALLGELTRRNEGYAPSTVTPCALPPVLSTDDPWTRPTTPCRVCGRVKWRVWRQGEEEAWRRICNGCR